MNDRVENSEIQPMWHHQQKSIEYALYRNASGIWSGMGSGKTRIAIEVIRRREHKLVLVICPKSVLVARVWEDQVNKFMPEEHEVISFDSGSVAAKFEQLRTVLTARRLDFARLHGAVHPLVCVFNYDSVWRVPLGDLVLKTNWDLIVLDEAHKIKAAGSKVSKYMARLGKTTAQKLALTGTPTPNGPLDVYGLYRFLDNTIFGTNFAEFANRYAVYGGFNNYQITKYLNLDELSRKMAECSVRYRTEDVLDLPPTMDLYRGVDKSPEMNRVYKDIDKHFISEVKGGVITASTVLVKGTRLQQLTSGFSMSDQGIPLAISTEKLQLLEEVLDELPTALDTDNPFNQQGIRREKVVIFYRFTLDATRIISLLKDRYLIGEISGRRNDYRLFKEGTLDILLVQMQAGSEGIDLTNARYAIYFSPLWDLGSYEQSKARLHRPGQKGTVRYIHLYVRDSIDVVIYRALKNKQDVNTAVLSVYQHDLQDQRSVDFTGQENVLQQQGSPPE